MSAELRKSDLAAVWDQLEKIETLIDASPAAEPRTQTSAEQPEPRPEPAFGNLRDRRVKDVPYAQHNRGRRGSDRKAG